MSLLMTLTFAFAGLNGLLALLLGGTYLRNHRQVKSPFTMALAMFALFFVVHSVLVLYHGYTMMATFTPQAERFLLFECMLETAALGALAYATFR